MIGEEGEDLGGVSRENQRKKKITEVLSEFRTEPDDQGQTGGVDPSSGLGLLPGEETIRLRISYFVEQQIQPPPPPTPSTTNINTKMVILF